LPAVFQQQKQSPQESTHDRPVLLKALQTNDPGNEHGFPYLWGSTGIGYNIARIKAVLGENVPVDSWDLIFKPPRKAPPSGSTWSPRPWTRQMKRPVTLS
jgi:spermidine/putrescine-binding protein